MRNTLFGLCAVLLGGLLFVTSTFAEHIYGPDELDTSYGAAFRLRQETWDNAFDFSDTSPPDDDNYWRLKTSVWLKHTYAKQYDLMVKLTNEARYFMSTGNETSRPYGLNGDEIVFDNLYASAYNVLGLPVDLIIGRQDFLMKYGEGFLIMDGTPLDGSRTFYFNAAKATVRLGEKHSLDIVYITNPKEDIYLPSAYPADKRQLIEWDESGLVVYGKSKVLDNLQIEPYYIYKKEETQDELDLNTIGARAVFSTGAWKLRGEFAHQFGKYNDSEETAFSDEKREANGGYLFFGRGYKDILWSPSWELGYVYLSGDDPDSSKDEGWDPLFSRWPWLSELYILTAAPERGIAYWTNLQWYTARVKLSLTDATRLDVNYNYVKANEDSTSGAPFYSRDGGKERGHLPQAKLSHKFSNNVDGYLLVEYMMPGDYYVNDDDAMFVRWQLQWKI